MTKLIITAALSGIAASKKMNPHIPVTPDEIAEDAVNCARAGAAIVHLHALDYQGNHTLDPEIFKTVCDRVREQCALAGLDIVLNITTNGGPHVSHETRLAHLPVCMPEMCTFDPSLGTMASTPVFVGDAPFPDKLSAACKEYNIKPEIEIYDGGMMHSLKYHIHKGTLRPPMHIQLMLGAVGAMPGNIESLAYLIPQIPQGCTWSIAGIGKTHMSMMLAGLAAGCTGLRVGLEDSLYLSRGTYATNVQFVEQAVSLAQAAGREIATAQDTREMLGLTKKVHF